MLKYLFVSKTVHDESFYLERLYYWFIRSINCLYLLPEGYQGQLYNFFLFFLFEDLNELSQKNKLLFPMELPIKGYVLP